MENLKIGDKAPLFDGTNQNGKKISLSDYLGKKVVLYFYPKDNTPGCTRQACNLRDNYQKFISQGYHILGISSDSETSHQKFIKKYELPFDLIADTDHVINEKYGVWKQKSFMGFKFWGTQRTTFVINEKGMIENIINKVETKNHSDQIIS